MKRIAPDDGYEFGNKRQYRRDIWSLFRLACLNQIAEAQALLMPSAEGSEIDVALNNGFRDYNLHVVDKNPAIVAHLKRRHPRINTYGVRASVAAQRINRSGAKLAVANLDLCNCTSSALIDELSRFAAAQPMVQLGAVAVTTLRGRERGRVWSDVKGHGAAPGFKDFDFGRVCEIAKALSVRLTDTNLVGADYVTHRVYRSAAGNQTMLWAMLQLRRETIGDLVRRAAVHWGVEALA